MLLLARKARHGWQKIGEIAFDDPEFSAGVSMLHHTIASFSLNKMSCKLILPSSEVLRIQVTLSDENKVPREAQIIQALRGRTPYPVEELIYDHFGEGPHIEVAAITLETLNEAERFARAHHFNPVYVTAARDFEAQWEPVFHLPSKNARTAVPQKASSISAALFVAGMIGALGVLGAPVAGQAAPPPRPAQLSPAQNATEAAVTMRPVKRPATLIAAARQADPARLSRAQSPAPAAITIRPKKRPEALIAAAPKTYTAPKKDNITVANASTIEDGIQFESVNLIGVFGKNKRRHALLRFRGGAIEKVHVGETVRGITVRAISRDEVVYEKRGSLTYLRLK